MFLTHSLVLFKFLINSTGHFLRWGKLGENQKRVFTDYRIGSYYSSVFPEHRQHGAPNPSVNHIFLFNSKVNVYKLHVNVWVPRWSAAPHVCALTPPSTPIFECIQDLVFPVKIVLVSTALMIITSFVCFWFLC